MVAWLSGGLCWGPVYFTSTTSAFQETGAEPWLFSPPGQNAKEDKGSYVPGCYGRPPKQG